MRRRVVDDPQVVVAVGMQAVRADESIVCRQAGLPLGPAPPGKGLKPPSGVASPTDGVGTSVQRGKLPKSRPVGDTAALVIMTLPDDATDISSIRSSARTTRE
jgi:hypothetical protein